MKVAWLLVAGVACAGLPGCASSSQQPGGDGGWTDAGPDVADDGGASTFCAADEDCPEGMVCNPFSNRCSSPPPDGGTPCQTDGDCPGSQECRYGICQEQADLPGIGEPCDLHCQGDLVCLSLWGEPETCHRRCSPPDPCPAHEHCVAPQGSDQGVCETDCNIYANDCPDGLTCLPLTDGGYSCFAAGTAEVGAGCDPAATDACAPGLICEANARVCAEVCDPAGVQKVCPAAEECVQPAGAEFGICK